eukprot:TRINITY_DN122750_c0_g1_i1.p1 TRINITY_DN122750_c0_g1~~TRINITY_DN122750_c0_g1_i1.p1  ORF type:complete len:341 (+),score=33.09 TRINITY_DN122750_c0_g1_i1:91-1113(+)
MQQEDDKGDSEKLRVQKEQHAAIARVLFQMCWIVSAFLVFGICVAAGAHAFTLSFAEDQTTLYLGDPSLTLPSGEGPDFVNEDDMPLSVLGIPDASIWNTSVDEVLTPELQKLAERVRAAEEAVLAVKQTLTDKEYMETAPRALTATRALQAACREWVNARYGPEPYKLRLHLEFPPGIFDRHEPKVHYLTVEMAPLELMPHSVYLFMDAMLENFRGAAFHRSARHVVQAFIQGRRKQVAFQEYSPKYSHQPGTIGFAGRPGGPGFYISLLDNTRNHGPGTQQRRNPYEADPCFAKVDQNALASVARKIQKMRVDARNGFVTNPANWVKIVAVTLLDWEP